MQFDYDFSLLLLIFMRMSGCVLFNPIFGRKNIPALAKAAITVMLTLFTYMTIDPVEVVAPTFIIMAVLALKELLIGFIIGFIINLFLSTVIVAGDLMDMQIGLSMSKIYDPASNVSMPVSASLINVMMMVTFFLSNGHLTLMKVFTYSAEIIQFGTFSINPQIYANIALMFQTILIYAMKMAMPVLAAEVITEMAVGLMMKAVPQVNIFAVNIQLKVLLGFIMLFLLVPPFAYFTDRLFSLMFENINQVLLAIR